MERIKAVTVSLEKMSEEKNYYTDSESDGEQTSDKKLKKRTKKKKAGLNRRRSVSENPAEGSTGQETNQQKLKTQDRGRTEVKTRAPDGMEHENTETCNLCNKKYKHKQSLERHKKEDHKNQTMELSADESGGDSDTEKIQCSFCPRKYLRVRSYREHIRKKHREKLYQEEAVTPVRRSLESTETGEGEEFWCSICLQNCKTPYAYNMHLTKYHQKSADEDMAKEENKASIEKSRVSSLKREPKVEVSTCVKTGEGTDHGEAPECPICQHKFSSTSNVRRHLKEVHRWSGMYPRRRSQWKFPQGMPLVDSECEDSMTESDDEHIVERVHCPSCSRSYKNKKTWLAHWNKKHVIKPSPKDATLCEKTGFDLMTDDETTDEEEDESYTDDQFCSACLSASFLNCRFCDQTLDNFGTLKRHYMDFHKSMLQSCASNPVTASGDSATCLHCDRPCDSGDGSVQTDATQLPAKSPLIVNCEADTGMAAICNCGLIYLSERNIKKHLEKKKDYHPDTTYTTISVEEARKIKTSECSFCHSVFRGPFHHKGLRKHLNEVHYEKKSNAANGKKSGSSIGGSVTDSEYNAGKRNKKQKRKSDPGGSYSAKSSSAPVESSQSSLAYLDLHTPTNQMSKNTTVSDENIVTEVLTNSAGRKGPIRLLNAASPKKSIQHFQNVSITVNADTSNDVRVVSKTTENKVKKYSGSRISLNSAFVFKSSVDQVQNKTGQAGPSSRDENREVRPAIVSTNSGDHVRPGVITCDKDKVKAVSVGVDNDTSSEGEKSPPQNRDDEQVTFNVPSYLSNSPSKYSPFVKLIKVDESDPKEPQRQLSKYASSKYSSKSVFGIRKPFKSKNVRFGSQSGQEEQTLASSSALSQTVHSGQHVSVLQPSLGAQQTTVSEPSSSHSSSKALSSTTESVQNVTAVTVAKPVNNVESTPTSNANENSQPSSKDDENFQKSSAEEKEMTSPKKSSSKSKQQSPKKSSPRKHAFALKKLLTENLSEKQFLPNTDVASPRAILNSKQVLRSGKTVKKSVEQGGISRKKKATSQPYLKRNTAISKIHAIKAKLSLRKRKPSAETERKSPRLKNKQDDQESQDLDANNEVVEEDGSGSERELEEDATLKIKTPTQKEEKKTQESSRNGKTAKKQEAHIDKDLEGSSFIQHETEEERVLKIENLKQKTSLLLHELDEMIHVPLQTQTKNVQANDQDENQAEVHMEVQTEMAQSSSMNTKKKKKFKLRILNSRSKLKKGKSRKVSREEVPITPGRNIEDSIHFPQLPAISKDRKGGLRTSSRIKPPETVSLDLSPRIVAIPSPTTGVLEKEATTTGVIETSTTASGVVENESTSVEVLEREASTTGVVETESTTTGVVEAKSTSTGVETESTYIGQTNGVVNENEHMDVESGKNNIPSRRARSWSPCKTRTAAAQDQLPLNGDLVAKTSKTPSEGSKKKAKLPNVSSEEGVTCSQQAFEGKLRIENRLVGSKMPIVKLNKLEDEMDGKYLKLVWDSIGAPPQSAENVCTERSEKRRTSRPITSRRRSLSADSLLARNDESRTPVMTSQETEEVEELSKNTGDGDREGLFKCLGLKQNSKPMPERKEIASIVSEGIENRVSVEEIEQTMEEEEEPGMQSQSDVDEREIQQTTEQDEASTDQGVQKTEVIVHQDNEIIAAISENQEKSDEVKSLENQKEVLSTEMLENVNVNRALVHRTDAVNNQSQILFVHENKVIYADSASVVPVNKDELSSLRDQVSEKRSERKKARKRKALEEDEIDGNVLPLVQPKKDVLLPETLSVCKDVVPKSTSVKPLRALEVKAVNDDEIVSSTIVEGNFGKQDLLASLVTLMECAEDPDREAPSIQVTEPSFLIKKEEKIKYPCHKCDINFCQKSNLKRHKATCHPEDEFRSFDIDKKSKEVDSIPLEEEVVAGEVEIFDIQSTGQGADVFGGMTASNEEDTMYSLPLSLIRESISRLTGYNVDAHLVLQRLKLQETIQIGDMTLKRIHKHTWRIMRKKHLPDSSAAIVEKEEHSQNQNEGSGELAGEGAASYEEDARNSPGATSENCSTNTGDISEQVSSGETSSSWTIHHKETSTSSSTVVLKKSRGEHHGIPKDNTKSSKSKRIKKKHVSVNKDTQAKLKIKLKSNVAAAPLTDFERAILEPKKKHKKLKRKHSAADSEKEQGRIDGEEVGKSQHSKVTDTHQKKQRDQEDKEKPREIGAVVPKSKIVQKILRDKAREEELERLKLVPTVEEPLPSFAEILQQKPKPVEVKTTNEKNGQEQSRGEPDELVINEDEPEPGNESPEEGNESPRDFSSNSSSGTGSKIPPYKSGSKSKVAKDKTEREEVLAAIQGRSIVPSSKPFRIPKTTAAEIDTLTKWKSPLQDIGHVEKFCFGAKPDGSTNKLKSRVGYSMGMTGSGQISVASSRKESLGNQYVEEIYNSIMSSSMKNPPIVEKSSGVLSLPLKNYRPEEPSTSTGVKRAADFEEDPVFKRPRVEASSVREEDMMTPDSTTPDRYLEEEQARSETGTSPAEEAVVSDMNTEDQNPPVVSSNVSSTGESDVWNENEVADQGEKVGLEKRGIPKYTSTPLKPNIPISAKIQSHIPDNVKTFSSDINCSKPELLNDPQKKIEISNNRTIDSNADDKTKDNEEDSVEVLESEPLDDQMEVDGVTEEEKGRQCEDNTEDVVELGDDKEEDMIMIEDKEEADEEEKDQSEEEDNEEEEEKSEKCGSEDSESSEESDQESESEEESGGNKTKHTTIETDVDVLDVLASDEESWLDEEEEESRSRKSEGREEDKWEDRPGEEDGSMEEGEDKEEDGEKEDDNVMEVEMEDEVPSTQTHEDGRSGTENVYVMESTVECEDIDFQCNTIMTDLIPKGFCFQFIQSNVCKKPMCMFRHEVPSKEELFKKGILEISNYHNMGNKARAYDVYKTLLDLKLQDMIPTKHIIMLLNLAEEDCDMNMALDLLRHVEKIKSIEFHEMLISMCSLSPGHYEKEMWKLFSCVQNLDKYLTGQNIVVLLRAFQEKQLWLKLWKVMNYSLCRPGFSPPVYITQSALGAVLETPDTCIPEASEWIENCDQEQLYNQDMELLGKVADIFIQHHHLKAANIVRTVAQKTQSVLIESHIGERDSDTSSVHSDAKSPILEVDQEEQKSNVNRIKGASMSRNWEYLAHLFLEVCDADKGKDPRYIRTFVEGLTLDKKNPNTLVDAFKSFMENVNNIYIKEKAEDAMISINKPALAVIGAELLHFCAMSQWWREGLAVIQILQKNNIQYLTRKSPEGALMSTIALDVCLRCKKPYQAVQLLTACNWSFVDGLKLEKPDFKERVILLYNIVKLFTGMKRPAMALMMICKVLQKAQRDQQVEFYNSLIGFGENFHLVINQCLDIGDPQRAYAAFEVFKNGCTGESIDPGMLRRLVTVCGECRYLDPGAHNVYNYLTAQSVYPPQNIPTEPRALCIDLAEHMSLMECVLLIEDFMLYLYSFLCEWCVHHQSCVVPEEYLNVSVRFLNKDLAHTKMEKRLKMLRNLLETNLTPGLKAFIRRRRPAEDSVVQVCSPSLFQYILALDKGERGKRQGFKRGPVGIPKSGPWSRQTLI
ncbi:uncharacterized protein LOC134230092 isoform X2 [Saccostrea cucullata]|uniref:uncharacterized protein LOC134230092 isoform X2 n=1 Tax=Saccostrea cuccullata TaxID=36930 RepID=UPI002ED20F45